MANRVGKSKFYVEYEQPDVKCLREKFEKIEVHPPKPQQQSVRRRSQAARSANASNHRKLVWCTLGSLRTFSYERFSEDTYEDVEELPQKNKHKKWVVARC